MTSLTSAVASEAKARRSRLLLLLPAIGALLMFLGAPLIQNALRSFGISDIPGSESGFTWRHYEKLFTDAFYVNVTLTTLKVAAVTTAISLLIGYPVAYFMVRNAGRLAVPILFILVWPLLTSIIMRTFGWRVLFARHGFISEWLQAIGAIEGPLNLLGTATIVYLGMVHVAAPFMVLSILPVLRGVDTRLEESARILGAGPWRTFFTVTLPLSIEGVITGCVLVFMVAVGSFMTMLLLGDGAIQTLPLLIFQQFSQSQDMGFASSMGNLLLFIVLICLYLQARTSSGSSEK